MEAPKINQKEYLQKYLSGGNDIKKKKKKKVKVGPKKVKIIDDDVDITNMRAVEDGEFDILNATEDAPQIVGVIDERGPVDFSDSRRWKIIADDGDGNVAVSKNVTRQQVVDNEDVSTQKNDRSKAISRQYFGEDLSPPRKSWHKSKKHRKKRHKHGSRSSSSSSESSDSDCQSRRKPKKRESRKMDEDHRGRVDSDLSPPRSRPGDSSGRPGSVDSDLSPPRQQRRDRRGRRNSDSDLSPPRARRRGSADSDLSPPRPRRRRDHERRRGSDSDLSPPRKKKHSADRRPRNFSPENDNQSESRRLKKTLDGKIAGLQNSSGLKEEAQALRQREAELFAKMSAEVGGAPQYAVVRKNGKRRDTEADVAERQEQEKRQEEIDAKYAKWGKGLKQVDDRAEQLKQDLYEMSKPLARYKDDKDLDALSRAQEREGDVMLEEIKRRQIAQGIRKPDEPKYQGSYMPNRFGIVPGHRWDGVDRGNGYEKKWFDAKNARRAMQDEAYKWSTADM